MKNHGYIFLMIIVFDSVLSLKN